MKVWVFFYPRRTAKVKHTHIDTPTHTPAVTNRSTHTHTQNEITENKILIGHFPCLFTKSGKKKKITGLINLVIMT